MMNENEPTPRFWLGNGVMAVALLMLLFMGRIWELLGVGAMVLWVLLVGVGVYLLMSDKKGRE
ncbi:MAG: hypothetical protein OEZ16_07705 [Chromatiales bacterium]|nr:hypothetical protein [Chromatiales bacterium]